MLMCSCFRSVSYRKLNFNQLTSIMCVLVDLFLEMFIHGLQDDPPSTSSKSKVNSWVQALQLLDVWFIQCLRNKLQLLWNVTRCREGFASCFWWETLCCYGGSEGWIFLFNSTIHNTEWTGTAPDHGKITLDLNPTYVLTYIILLIEV